jgi:hypothetical protein
LDTRIAFHILNWHGMNKTFLINWTYAFDDCGKANKKPQLKYTPIMPIYIHGSHIYKKHI